MSDPSPSSTVRLELGDNRTVSLELDGLRLEVEEGPEQGHSEVVCMPRVKVGSAPDNDLVLDDPSVSRHHAELELLPEGRVRIEDQGSTNGTEVNEVRLGDGEVALPARVRVGESVIAVTRRTQRHTSMVLEEDRLEDLVGGSPAMRELYGVLRAAAPAPLTVLITGESGTGKELAARALHTLSEREGPLVVFDAGATDPEMVRSELFGHVKGAFTGASGAREGAFRRAEGGTLFLDEIGELPLELQPRLLRALEARQVQPVGADRSHRVDVRVVAATNRDLAAMVREGTFREDLFHRLAILPIRMPPLRERRQDVPAIIRHLVKALGLELDIPEATLEACARHDWPGNVRALRNALERAAVLCRGREVKPEDLLQAPVTSDASATPILESGTPAGAGGIAPGETIQEVEKRMILAALERHEGDKQKAATEVGISIGTLRRRLKEYED